MIHVQVSLLPSYAYTPAPFQSFRSFFFSRSTFHLFVHSFTNFLLLDCKPSIYKNESFTKTIQLLLENSFSRVIPAYQESSSCVSSSLSSRGYASVSIGTATPRRRPDAIAVASCKRSASDNRLLTSLPRPFSVATPFELR